jgi:hypothetical protein
MPDLPYLVGSDHADVIEKSNAVMRDAIASLAEAAEEAKDEAES